MIAGGHVDVCYWQGDHRSDHKGKLRGRFVGVVVNAYISMVTIVEFLSGAVEIR